jgi:hypothetical protein
VSNDTINNRSIWERNITMDRQRIPASCVVQCRNAQDVITDIESNRTHTRWSDRRVNKSAT